MEVLSTHQNIKNAMHRCRNKNKIKYLIALSICFLKQKLQNAKQKKRQYERKKQLKLL